MWPNPQETFTFTEEILNERLHFLCSVARVFPPMAHIQY